MGSTESDRKRRHFTSVSPTAALSATKKHPLLPISEEKKHDTAVLKYQNQKLVQQLEVQKAEYIATESKLCELQDKQQDSDNILTVVKRSWNKLIDDLESCSIGSKGSNANGQDHKDLSALSDKASPSPVDTFLSRLVDTGATESCSTINTCNQVEVDYEVYSAKTRNILHNIVTSISDVWNLERGLLAAMLESLPSTDPSRLKTTNDLATEVKNLRLVLGDLHLKHKLVAGEVQSHRDINAKDKTELKRLEGELKKTVLELNENNDKLASLKAQRDTAKGASFPVLSLGNSRVSGDKGRDKQKDVQDIETELKDLMDLASSRLLELKSLHEQRIGILNKLLGLQTSMKSVKHISSTQAYRLANDQLGKSKAELARYQALYEKLQAEKDNLVWREAEVNLKMDLADIFQRASTVADSRISVLEKLIQKQIDDRNMLETKLDEALREPGRKEIITEFKALVSSFPKKMSIMQSQLRNYKEAASEIHSLRAEVQSLSNILTRKLKELEILSGRCASQNAEIQKLKDMAHDLRESDQELKLFLEMYQRESTESREVMEARDSEYYAWAHVQSLKSSLDEHSLESRVKAANEAEAISQQRLATAEAEIADLRQRLDTSTSDVSELSDVLKSKHEEGEAYLSEIETIGQAYEDMQTQNQHLLQQITERDDYNIKLVLEGAKARQLQDSLRIEKQTVETELRQANASMDFYSMKGARIEDQLRMLSDHREKLGEDKRRSSAVFDNIQKRLLDSRRESQKLRGSLGESQSKVERRRMHIAELQIELENERFTKKRVEEDLEVARRKAAHLRARTEGSALEKLQQEVREYREILKCSICHERPKEVVITKCYHLFCNTCVQRTLESRHRKCSVCAASFGPNDVKPVYI
ncbi:E3 ubiquitin protein ligase [Thalictrum thalictroides]|uniref:E3 ubiquitin protein ligase n=1 Tax=Thalictrum thalictroides TaxID=46969 RepID=A0A7J6W413_THATH|nr:E3 ubiquitin protein ligase [Thalictrum thalictroides]